MEFLDTCVSVLCCTEIPDTSLLLTSLHFLQTNCIKPLYEHGDISEGTQRCSHLTPHTPISISLFPLPKLGPSKTPSPPPPVAVPFTECAIHPHQPPASFPVWKCIKWLNYLFSNNLLCSGLFDRSPWCLAICSAHVAVPGSPQQRGVREQNTLFSEPWHVPPQKNMQALVYCVRALELRKGEIIHSNDPTQLMLSFLFFF